MWGGVGRGKSLYDGRFYSVVPVVRKTRVHFHEFMREVHRQLDELRAWPIRSTKSRAASRKKIPPDLLRRVPRLRHRRRDDPVQPARRLLFDNGVSFVMTSNYDPDTLYPDGLHRDRLLPTIALLKEKLDVLNVDAGIDYRKRALEQVELVLHAARRRGRPRAAHRLCEDRRDADEDPRVHIEQREIRALRRAGGIIWFDFATLVRRSALAERLPGNRQPLPHRDPVRRSGDVGRRSRRRRAASPGWSTCSTTTRSSC